MVLKPFWISYNKQSSIAKSEKREVKEFSHISQNWHWTPNGGDNLEETVI